MTRTNNSGCRTGHVLALALTLVLMLAICFSSTARAASAAVNATQKVVVSQTFTGDPDRRQYTYELRDDLESSPMPEGTKDGVYSFTLNGNDRHEFTLTIPGGEGTRAQYVLTRKEAVPSKDKVSPEEHIFGFEVSRDKNGELIVIPYTCEDKDYEILTEQDVPVGIELFNVITGEEHTTQTTTTQSTTSANAQTTTRTVRTVTTIHVNKTVKAGRPNTGDPYQVWLWVGLVVVAAGGLIAVAIIRRKKEKDEDNS